MGAILGPYGMAAGAIGGAIVGGITSYMEKSQKIQEEAAQKQEERFQQAMKDLSMTEAKIFMDSNQVGTSLVLGHNYQVQ